MRMANTLTILWHFLTITERFRRDCKALILTVLYSINVMMYVEMYYAVIRVSAHGEVSVAVSQLQSP